MADYEWLKKKIVDLYERSRQSVIIYHMKYCEYECKIGCDPKIIRDNGLNVFQYWGNSIQTLGK